VKKIRQIPFEVVTNKLKTGEAGKAVALKRARHEIVALIDSDNILPHPEWLSMMLAPFSDPEIVASEPIAYTHRPEDGYITRYCALLGMNDPLCLFLGNYDRLSQITHKWTEMPVCVEDQGDYLKVKLNEKKIPTIGANGFCIRRQVLLETMRDAAGNFKDYLFDIDIIYKLLTSSLPEKVQVAKVKTGIIHLFSGDLKNFARKQNRRIKDFSYFATSDLRLYPWRELDKWRLFKFVCYCLTGFPLFVQALRGYSHHPDIAWFFHPLACWITLWVYGKGTITGKLTPAAMNRHDWRQ
jgi:glycosyltransferase involved in cell wall biosynthesis